MDKAITLIRHLINLDKKIRQNGKVPSPSSVRRILDLILEKELHQDESVREWVVARASVPDLFITCCVLKIGLRLVKSEFIDDSLSIAKAVIDVVTDGDHQVLGERDFSHLRELELLLSEPGLVSNNPETWGRYLIQLQAAALCGHRSVGLPYQEYQISVDGSEDEVKTDSNEYKIVCDDYPDIWYYQYGHQEMEFLGVLTKAVERGLKDAVRHHEPEVFCMFCELLVTEVWAITKCQVLSTLYDFIRESAEPGSWQINKAIELLSDSRCEYMRGATNFRRLLRLAVKQNVSVEKRETLIECIRLYAPSDGIRINELADLEDWDLLNLQEEEDVKKAKKDEALYCPYDPRDIPKTEVTFSRIESSENGLASQWPHKEDQHYILLFEDCQPPANTEESGEVKKWLLPRLAAISVVANRDDSYDEQWFGEITGWCAEVLKCFRRWKGYCGATVDGHVVAKEGEYVELLDENLSWWRKRAEASLRYLETSIPQCCMHDAVEHLGWSTNDPFYAGLVFLDELLAINDCTELDCMRDKLAEIITMHWGQWSLFTHATVLVLLRPFHWSTVEPMAVLLRSEVEDEENSVVLMRVLQHLLSSGLPNIAEILERVWNRIDTLSDPAKIASLIGGVVGNAVMRCQAADENHSALVEISQWCDRLQCGLDGKAEWQMALLNGILLSTENYLGRSSDLTNSHADTWLVLAKWVIGEYLDKRQELEGRADHIREVMNVLDMSWPVDIRARLFEEIGDCLERLIREGGVGDFCMLHYDLKNEIRGERAENGERGVSQREIVPSDSLLLRLCRVSAERVAEWRRNQETTNDIIYGQSLWGRDTGELIEQVFLNARDREYVRKELAPIIDVLATAGLTTLVTDLRIKIRNQ